MILMIVLVTLIVLLVAGMMIGKRRAKRGRGSIDLVPSDPGDDITPYNANNLQSMRGGGRSSSDVYPRYTYKLLNCLIKCI